MLSAEDGAVRIVDTTGRIVANVGDDVRFGATFANSQSGRRRELEQRLSGDCPGPYKFVGDHVTAVSLDGPTTLSLPGLEVHFRLKKTIAGPRVGKTAAAAGELVLGGCCLRLKVENRDSTYFIVWPAGFTPHVHRDVVHVRNGAGRIIAQVGDELRMGGAYLTSYDDEECSGPAFSADEVKVVSYPESP